MKAAIQYIGRRVANGKVYQAFLNDKEEVYYSGIKYCTIGEWYYVKKVNKNLMLSKMPDVATGPSPSDALLKSWHVLDYAAKTFTARKRQANQRHEVARRIGRILSESADLISYSNVDDFLKVCIDEVFKEKSARESAEFNRRFNAMVRRQAKIDRKKNGK